MTQTSRPLPPARFPIGRRRFVAGVGAASLVAATGLPLPAWAQGVVTIRRGNGSEPGSLDPHKASGTWENNIIGDIFVGLFTEDAAAQPIYGAAESHTVSDDGLVWTFKIREGHSWSDGTPVTADDFVYAYRRILTPAFAAEYASLVYLVKNGAAVNKGEVPPEQLGVRAVDPRTFEVTLENPAPWLPQALTHYTYFPVPKHLVEANPDNWTQPGTMVTNGAYVPVEWRPREYVRAVRNERFYDAASVAIGEVFYYPTDDTQAATRRFRAGELDLNMDWAVAEGRALRQELGEEVARSITGLSTTYIAFNTQKAPFSDVRVRQALGMALNQEAVADRVLAGFSGKPTPALVPQGVANYPHTAKLRWFGKLQADRETEARRLLQEAGFGEGGQPLRFTYLYRQTEDHRKVASAYQSMWAKIGAQVTIESKEIRQFYDAVRVGDYQVSEAGWVADFNDAYNFLFLAEAANIGQLNYARFNDPEYDRMLTEANRELDLAARGQKLNAAEQYMLDRAPYVPTRTALDRHLVSRKVQGWVDNARDVYRTRWLSLSA